MLKDICPPGLSALDLYGMCGANGQRKANCRCARDSYSDVILRMSDLRPADGG